MHRIVALRQLGFGLGDITRILTQGVDAEDLTALLRVRRAEVEVEYQLARTRLSDVERRLTLIEQEHFMSRIEIIDKPLPALRLAARQTTVAEQPEIAEVLGSLFDTVAQALAGVDLGMPVAQYRSVEAGAEVTAGFEYSGEATDSFTIVVLPASASAVCGVHLGSMDRIHESWQAVHQEILARKGTPNGPCRELYVRSDTPDQSGWVTELQQPYERY